MPEVNGVCLSSVEFQELETLVELSESGEDWDWANDKLAIGPGCDEQPPDEMAVYGVLGLRGLVRFGKSRYGPYVYRGVTPAGRSFVSDYAAKKAAEAKDVRSSRRHDWLMAIFSVLGGGALGTLSSVLLHFWGVLS